MPVPIISVTGTKGKTTTVAVIADVLQKLHKNVLKVDTTGHFINGERKSTLEDSKDTWHLVPSVAPGRYLYEFFVHPELKVDGVAVLESSLGSSSVRGMAYSYHNVGVFLNVFEDHIGSSERIQSKADIAKAKDFIFSKIYSEGYAVFNADDEYVVGALEVIPERLTPITLIPCGITFEKYDIAAHYANGGVAFTVNDGHQIVLRDLQGDTIIADLKVIPWTFNGTFIPSVWNLLSAAAALYGYFKGVLPQGVREALESVRLDQYGGRLTLLENAVGVKILADYAHEKVSLSLVGDLARTQVGPGGRVIGVVRLAHDRSDDLMRETGQTIASHYDQFVVYDKIDGFLRQGKDATRFPQIVGRTSEIFTAGIASVNPNVVRVVREDEAIIRAAQIAQPGDVVVIIVNDDIERSIGYIKDSFKAEFI
jgi:cyanophycin synthetase